jgi:uncharacterized protein
VNPAAALEPSVWLALAAWAFGTSLLTAVLGLGGGVVLLAAMLLHVEPLVAIPLHAAVQIISNATRTWIQREHVAWRLFAWHAPPLLPAGLIGLYLAQGLPADLLSAIIGGFVLLATWRPRWLFLGLDPARVPGERRFFALGCVTGVLNPMLGATGPLLGPFFLNLGLSRQAIVGTFAACQVAGHLVKLVLFGSTGFDFAPFALPLLLLCVLVVAGTWVGSWLLDSVDERVFTWLYRGVLSAVGLRLLLVDGWAWLRG